MWPTPEERVFFREEYHSLGERAPVQLLGSRDGEMAWVCPEDPKLWKFPPERNPHALVPPIQTQVPLRKLRRVDAVEQDNFITAVREGKYRKANLLLRNDPLIDPLGNRDHPTTFIVQEIEDTRRRRAMLDVLLAHGANIHACIHARDRMGWTAIHHAIQHENLDAAQELVDRGATLTGFPSPVMDLPETAIRSGSFQSLGWLAKKDVSLRASKYLTAVEKRHDQYDKTTYQSVVRGVSLPPLHQLALGRFERADYFIELFQTLRQQGWNFASVDHNGLSALEVASRHGWAGSRMGADYLLSQEQAQQLAQHATEPRKQAVRRSL